MTGEYCGNCKFYNAIKSEKSLGYCLRYPPIPATTVLMGSGRVGTYWPEVNPGQFCGEFQSSLKERKA